jgi:PAS domain S-box-containing protein
MRTRGKAIATGGTSRNGESSAFESVVRYSEDAIITKDLRGNVLSWNPAARRLFGYSSREMVGRSITTVIPPERLDEEKQIIAQIRRGLRVEPYETIRLRKDGHPVDVSVSVSPVFDGAGKIVGAATIIRDISQRKKAEEELRRSEERFRQIYQHAPVGLEQVAIKGDRLLEVNDCLCRMLGYSREELLSKTYTQVTDPQDIVAERKLLRRMIAGEIHGYTIEKRYIRNDGRRIWVRVSSTMAAGSRYRISVIEDISRRKESEAALLEGSQRMSAIVETAVDAIVTIDERGMIESANAATEQLFGYSRREMLGRNVKLLMPDPFSAEHDVYLRNYLKSGRAKIIGIGREVTGMRKDGTTFPLHLSVSEVRLEGRRLFTGILHDLSGRRALEHQIIEASTNEQRRIGQDLHDGLCQDLIGIAFQADFAARNVSAFSPEDGELVRRIAASVRSSATQARRLSHGLNPVDLAGGGLPVALEALARRVTESFKIDCNLKWDHEAEVDQEVVATHMFRIAQEAISNAIKHGKARRIDLKLACEAGRVTLCIRDNGRGFPAQFKVPHTPHSQDTSSGIGMHTMRYRANMIGAVLEITSRPGKGTLLKCSLVNRGPSRRTI